MIEMDNLFEPFSSENTELMMEVAESEIGEQLARQIRYERYCVIPEGITHYDLPPDRQAEVTRQWCEELLDADVNNLHHNPMTAVFGQWAARFDGLDEAATDRVVRALLVHDVKEVRFSAEDEGDLTFDETEAAGMEGFKKEHGELATMLMAAGFVDEATAVEIESDLNDGKRRGSDEPETVYGQYVEIAERLGYIHAAGLAVDAAIDILTESEHNYAQYKNLLWMAENCYANSLARLVDLSANFPCIEEFLRLRRDEISHHLVEIKFNQAEILELYRDEGKDELHVADREAKFNSAYEQYQQKAA